MEISLNRLQTGQQGVVTCIDTDIAFRSRLRVFGMVPGTKVRCRYRSPGGSVMALEFRGTVLAVRTRDVKNIRVCCL